MKFDNYDVEQEYVSLTDYSHWLIYFLILVVLDVKKERHRLFFIQEAF